MEHLDVVMAGLPSISSFIIKTTLLLLLLNLDTFHIVMVIILISTGLDIIIITLIDFLVILIDLFGVIIVFSNFIHRYFIIVLVALVVFIVDAVAVLHVTAGDLLPDPLVELVQGGGLAGRLRRLLLVRTLGPRLAGVGGVGGVGGVAGVARERVVRVCGHLTQPRQPVRDRGLEHLLLLQVVWRQTQTEHRGRGLLGLVVVDEGLGELGEGLRVDLPVLDAERRARQLPLPPRGRSSWCPQLLLLQLPQLLLLLQTVEGGVLLLEAALLLGRHHHGLGRLGLLRHQRLRRELVHGASTRCGTCHGHSVSIK